MGGAQPEHNLDSQREDQVAHVGCTNILDMTRIEMGDGVDVTMMFEGLMSTEPEPATMTGGAVCNGGGSSQFGWAVVKVKVKERVRDQGS